MTIHMPPSFHDSSIRCSKLNAHLQLDWNAAPDGNYYYHNSSIEPQQPEKTKEDPKLLERKPEFIEVEGKFREKQNKRES